MKARSTSPTNLSRIGIPDLYEMQVKRVQVWGVQGYDVPKKYFGASIQPVQLPRSRSDSSSKKNKNAQQNSPPSKGYYLDKQMKLAARSPSSAQYNRPKKWALNAEEMEEAGKKLNQLNYHTDRRTFIDDIKRHEQKNGSSRRKYRRSSNELSRRLAEQKRERDEMIAEHESRRQKKNCFDELEVLADSTPGPGQYNPHMNILKIKVDRRDCDFWKEKHASPSPVRDKLQPGVGTYTHFPAAYRTFGKMQVEQDKKEKEREDVGLSSKNPPLQKEGEKYLHSGFGIDRRTSNPKFSKSKLKYASTPGPGSHNLMEQWENKKQTYPMKTNMCGQNPLKHISKGIQKSIYYE